MGVSAVKRKANTERGRQILRKHAQKFATDLVAIETEAMTAGDHAEALRCLEIILPYCFPKLQAIEVSADRDKAIGLLEDIRKAAMGGVEDTKRLPVGDDETDNKETA